LAHGSSYPEAQSSLSFHLLYGNLRSAPTKGQRLHNELNDLKHVAINFKLPNKAVSKTLQSANEIIHIKHRYNLFNQHLAQRYIAKTAVS